MQHLYRKEHKAWLPDKPNSGRLMELRSWNATLHNFFLSPFAIATFNLLIESCTIFWYKPVWNIWHLYLKQSNVLNLNMRNKLLLSIVGYVVHALSWLHRSSLCRIDMSSAEFNRCRKYTFAAECFMLVFSRLILLLLF